MRHSLAKLLIAVLALSFSSVASASHSHHMSGLFKLMAGGAVAVGIMNIANRCKYGVVDSTVTDPVTGIGNPGKVCASAPSSNGGYSDYTDEQINVITKSTKELNKNMNKNGEPKQKGCARHHIIPEFDNKISENEDMRGILKKCNIDINDAINGVNLPYKDDAECQGARHGPLHTDKYYRALAEIILPSYDAFRCGEIRNNLRSIKQDLMENKLNSNGY